MTKRKEIELLAPAKNATIAKEAILHGADAVYIGAARFSARAAAGNSIKEIAQLTHFAHDYGARVYIALNTIVKDEELKEVEELIKELYSAKVDALIIQDMGITQLNIPPIALHASTQTDNCTSEKVSFLEQNGFSQVVLARELSLQQIRDIRAKTSVRLEAFVHGALCVSYSGRCYISQALCNRSANRGECAQYCRLPYDLIDATGNVLQRQKHLLSLRDLNRSDQLEALLDAGISSLKIEGRLKEIDYVKNITAYYRQRLDDIFKRREEYTAASSGQVTHTFTPNPSKSFNRNFTNFYLFGERKEEVASFDTPKSVGEKIGTVKSTDKKSIRVAGIHPIHNGDGLCFIDGKGKLNGFRVNRVDENTIYPNEMPRITTKTTLYRNLDFEFEKILQKPSSDRTIAVDIQMHELPFGYALSMEDEDGNRATRSFSREKQTARQPQTDKIKEQLAKLGGTIFHAATVDVTFQSEQFIHTALLNEWRREVVEKLLSVRRIKYRQELAPIEKKRCPYHSESLDYTGNVMNRLAKQFYAERGVLTIESAFELEPRKEAPLMFTKHCIRHSLGLCPKEKGTKPSSVPLFLVYKDTRLRLEFDCKQCEMRVTL